MIVGLALLRRELALQLLERSLLERQPTGDVVALTLSMRNLALRSGMILHLNVVRHAQYLRQQVSSPLGSTQWVLAPTPIWLARHPSQSGHREMRTFISMDSISRNDTPRFFMLSRNASKSAKALPGPPQSLWSRSWLTAAGCGRRTTYIDQWCAAGCGLLISRCRVAIS